MRPLVRHLLLALVLLLAQQGALLHPLSHVSAATQSEGDDGRHAHGGPCIGCLAFAELGAAAAPAPVSHGLGERLAFRLHAAPAAARHTLEAPPQHNRGPPTVL
ncbi:MAG: hypothetical protein KIT60_15685 [Burkholderiaceae bacterium]|nr:hypothetical protein [Burkholderiaceae bacterium]